MRINTQDLTLQRNYLEKYQYLISEYELVKQKKHPRFKLAKDFYSFHHTCRQSFLKYYNRFLQSGGDMASLLPQKRGPKYKTRRIDLDIEADVGIWRDKGNNRYEIVSILKPKYEDKTPSPSGVYNVCKRLGKNKLNIPMKEEKRQIIKDRLGEAKRTLSDINELKNDEDAELELWSSTLNEIEKKLEDIDRTLFEPESTW